VGTALPRFLLPENVGGAGAWLAVLSGETKPTNMNMQGTEIGPAVFEGTLSRPSESTVVTK
jgi:hypothetical protein